MRISVRNAAGEEIESVDSMKALQARVFSGEIKPSQLHVVREIETPAPAEGVVDTVVFSDVQANYDIVEDPNSTTRTITHARGTQIDGEDTVRNVERLVFADGTIELQPGNNPATGTVNITGTAAEDQLLTAVRAFNDGDGVKPNTTVFDWQIEEQPDQWVTIARGSELRLGDGEVGSRIRVEATYEDNKGVQEIVRSAAVGPVTNVNDHPSPDSRA